MLNHIHPLQAPQAAPSPPALPCSEGLLAAPQSGIYSYLLRECLWCSEQNERAIKEQYGLPPSTQNLFGYRAAPRLPSPRSQEQHEAARRQHERLDQFSDEEFFDWLTYEKEPLAARLLETVDPYTIIDEELNEKFGPVDGIPGLYVDYNTLKIKTFPRGCVIVPCRLHGLIRALQIYPRPSDDHFFWYSTPNAHGGASVRASIHIANEHRAAIDGVALIVPHTIAADAEAWKSGRCVVAVNNISPRRFLRYTRDALPKLKALVVDPKCGELLARILKENYPVVYIVNVESAEDE